MPLTIALKMIKVSIFSPCSRAPCVLAALRSVSHFLYVPVCKKNSEENHSSQWAYICGTSHTALMLPKAKSVTVTRFNTNTSLNNSSAVPH